MMIIFPVRFSRNTLDLEGSIYGLSKLEIFNQNEILCISEDAGHNFPSFFDESRCCQTLVCYFRFVLMEPTFIACLNTRQEIISTLISLVEGNE